jgi:hypothetical protein
MLRQNILFFRLPSKNVKVNIYKTKILCCNLWIWNLVSYVKGRAPIECLRTGSIQEEYVYLRDEVTGGWRDLHNEKFHNLYSSRNIISKIKSKGIG